MIEFKYNRKKIYLFLIFSILIIILFGYTFINAEMLALKKPQNSYSKYRWVSRLFYKNENLLKYLSGTISLLFIFFNIFLIKILAKKSAIFKIQDGNLYQDDKYLIEIDQIIKLELKSVNHNHFIDIFLKDPKRIIEVERNLLKKIVYKICFYTGSAPLTLNISFLEKKPKTILKNLKKLIA